MLRARAAFPIRSASERVRDPFLRTDSAVPAGAVGRRRVGVYPRRLHRRAGRSLLRVRGVYWFARSSSEQATAGWGLAGATEHKLRERVAVGAIVIRFTASDRGAADSLRVSYRSDGRVGAEPGAKSRVGRR